ncbi:Iron-uptake system permease protein FeuB [Actinomyces bovis]|uniref:Iron-uptake system permease protein FeuB n=1 Tax=Actinomyces bovis TaxID=1658 RepID=A0ABY1VQM9_9ACTO|nr:iron chelate uptake ABC transporter family permease subunit [Actinomyces bovis]SPT53946.1 Iron-uptake system permease protein FeuB [Actinomyces bovis]VEG53459.1 Iron-uptake system permease protein FeuB [Actinomyces israelii]
MTPTAPAAGLATRQPHTLWWLAGGLCLLALLLLVSVTTGTAQMSLLDLLRGQADEDQLQVLLVSRLPRTLAVLLAGSTMAVAGLVMQLITRNRFVEPSTTGVTQAAGLGVLVAVVFLPQLSLWLRMVVAVGFALAGTAVLMALVRAVPSRDPVIVPLLGIILTGVISAAGELLAWQTGLQGQLGIWLTGNFASVIKGRYELLWITLIVALLVYALASALTIVGMGEGLSTSLGIDHRRVSLLGLGAVAVISGVTTVVAGTLPFLGLVIPNLVSLLVGDYVRRSLPLVALGGALFVLLADLLGRSLIAPAEIPVGVVMGVLGSAIFVVLLSRQIRRRG